MYKVLKLQCVFYHVAVYINYRIRIGFYNPVFFMFFMCWLVVPLRVSFLGCNYRTYIKKMVLVNFQELDADYN